VGHPGVTWMDDRVVLGAMAEIASEQKAIES
jgi:hypothetical protein